MERVLAPANLRRAYQRGVSNKGAPGADGMTVEQLADYTNQYWPILKARLLAGEYHPQGVRAVETPKPKGGTRRLGIPCVVDRLIQQALLQQLTPIFDPLFSDYSYGFRPNRSAHQAIETARAHVAAGHRWCVELDLEKFFDRVNHDVLMAYVERQIEDKRRLKLTLNREKSRVARPWVCDYLGYGRTWHQHPRMKVASLSLHRLRDRLRELLRGARGQKMAGVIERINPMLRGWAGYFKLSQSRKALEELDGWVRRKLRCILWRQWKQPSTRARNLMRRGLKEERACKSAFNGRGPWWNSGASHMNQALPKKLWDQLGLVSILDTINGLSA
ncbi:group II intron reverse transcriptase/maturase [Pseudomonas sp. NFACC23-1]|nr:group II intron reverse transcriptase/maturase [Pseudomonas sp. NFACC17-2]SEI92869.1 group II intron reverse transcriptase/maturase [Pseudomonas sp. NFACC23-1]SFW85170.1 group II intron reverse transcriptase/maturase [Pseudomonas sp. NFACC16-2]